MEKAIAQTTKVIKKNDMPPPVVKEPTTLEEAKKQIEVLNQQLHPNTPPEPTAEEITKKEKQMQYFKELSRGASFIDVVIEDLNRAGFNRKAKRRIITELMNKKYSTEFVAMYEVKINDILKFLEAELTLTAGEDLKKDDKIVIEGSKIMKVKPPIDAKDLLDETKCEAEEKHKYKLFPFGKKK